MLMMDVATSSGMNNLGINTNFTSTKKTYRKKPDPTAPKITRPCTECGKKFWSWQALFGHMRCHPQRQWRGIYPPPNIHNRHKEKASSSAVTDTSTLGCSYDFLKITEDDHHAASTLLMLSSCSNQVPTITTSENVVSVREGVGMMSCSGGGGGVELLPGTLVCGKTNFRFECTSCKKVFGSPQALGGHRASHKNVKGCFANTRNGDVGFLKEELLSGIVQNCDGGIVVEDENDKMLNLGLGLGLSPGLNSNIQLPQYHQCNICFRDFPTGQALGGHKRCHWEKWDNSNNKNHNESSGINWNLSAPTPVPPSPRIFERDSSSCSPSMSLERLELRLAL